MSDLADKIAEANAGGHTISPHLEAVLTDLDQRLTALEEKKKPDDGKWSPDKPAPGLEGYTDPQPTSGDDQS